MTTDPTEEARRALVDNANLARLEGPTWTTEQLLTDFEVHGFLAPFVAVRRRSDGVVGSLQFTHSPRLYFGFKED